MYGERIREKRESHELSRSELAKLIMTTPQNIKLWEEEKIPPTINDLIALADTFETSVDWLVGFSEECDEDEEDCSDCDGFIECKLVPHMNNFMSQNDEPAYIHVQLATGGDGDDCVLYTGSTTALLSSLNLVLKSIANENGINYYDLVAIMASVQAKSELGGLTGDE